MTELTELQVKLAEQLLLSVLRKEPYVTYSELAERVNPPIHHRNVGKNIGQISILCHEMGLPLLSAKVINKTTAVAGEGFYALMESLGIPTDGKSEMELYQAERKAIRECKEWYRLEDHLGLKIGLPRPAHPLGEFYSWNLLQDDVAIKKGDKSFFEHNGSAIPKEIKWFFNCEGLQTSESREVMFDYQGRQYDGRLMNDPFDRCRIYWNTELGEEFQSHHRAESGEYPLIRFQRTAPDRYQIDFLDSEAIGAAEDDPLETVVAPQKEGRKREFYISKYERNPANRKNAIQIHGLRCMACGFDFEAFYGEAGRDFIEVHHVKPLSDIGEEVTIDPAKDLVCVCSNCHRIIHKKKNGVYTVEEVRAMIAAAKEKKNSQPI